MDNSRSLEALYQDGTGMVSLPKKSYKASIEGYDGFDDVLSAEMAKSEENLAFLDAFQMVETKNAADKVKMLKKISTVYGSRSGMPAAAAASIESLCRVQSLEEAEKAEATGVDTGNEKAKTPGSTEKKGGFFKTVFTAIGKFFRTIASMFKKLGAKIAALFKKDKPANPTEVESNTADMNLNNSSSETEEKSGTKTANVSGGFKASKDKKGKDYLFDIRSLNTTNLEKIVQKYQQTADRCKKLAVIPTEEAAINKWSGTFGEVTKNFKEITSAFGIKGNSNATINLTTASSFANYYKQAQKQFAISDEAAYDAIVKNMYGVAKVDGSKWYSMAENGNMQIKQSAIDSMVSTANKFADSANIFADVSDTLAKHVDESLSKRTVTNTNSNGHQVTEFGGRGVSDKDKQMKSGSITSEASIASMAAMLKFASTIGKTVIKISTKIEHCAVEADKAFTAAKAKRHNDSLNANKNKKAAIAAASN